MSLARTDPEKPAGSHRAQVAAVPPARPVLSVKVDNVRLWNVVERAVLMRAVQAATERLARPECELVVDDFGVRGALEVSGLTASEYLQRAMYFYDAPRRACKTSLLFVMTRPGSHALLVCGPRLTSDDARYVEAAVIHEMLHSLGLGENPPSSKEITAPVLARCR